MHPERMRLALLLTATILLLAVGMYVRQQVSQPEFVQQPRPDFTSFRRVEEKKRAFVAYMRPRIVAANEKVRAERAWIAELLVRTQTADIGEEECEHIGALIVRYEIGAADGESHADEWCSDQEFIQQVFESLLRRVDTVPVALALAQAAKESGWGTSRFAVDGHNYFGQHCYVKGCGEMPRRRASGRRHEVAVFESAWHSVEAYLLNLNTHPRYKALRAARQRIRREGQKLTGSKLAAHLEAYSERGAPYINEIKSLIRRNAFE